MKRVFFFLFQTCELVEKTVVGFAIWQKKKKKNLRRLSHVHTNDRSFQPQFSTAVSIEAYIKQQKK
jgi:hypothetical protein